MSTNKSDKTEKPTPKRREDAKKKGQVARGNEFPTALSLITAVFAASIFGQDLFSNFGLYFQSLSHKIVNPAGFTPIELHLIFIEALKYLAIIAIPIVSVSLVAGLAGNFAQGGLVLSTEKFKPKADKFNPAKNIKKIVGLDSIVNLSKSSVKLVVLTYVVYGVLSPMVDKAPSLLNAPIPTIVMDLGSTLFSLSFRCALVMLAFAFADYGYSIYKHEKSLKMSKQEIRDEFKQQEGDPYIKSQRRRAARALSQKRSLGEVSSASVVITNPTHISIALRYDQEKDAAPIVVAKGADIIAAKIREIAKEHNIPTIENKLLARALYKVVEPNQIIPVEFFGAVAEILAFVFRQKEGRV